MYGLVAFSTCKSTWMIYHFIPEEEREGERERWREGCEEVIPAPPSIDARPSIEKSPSCPALMGVEVTRSPSKMAVWYS